MSEDTPTTMPPPAPPQPKQPAFGRIAASFIGAAVAVLLVLVVFPAIASLHRDYRDLQQFQEEQESENEANDSDVEFLSNENQELRERILSLENCGELQTYDPAIDGCRSDLDPSIVFPTMQQLLEETVLPEIDLVEGMNICLPEETYVPSIDMCQLPDGTLFPTLPNFVEDTPPTTQPPLADLCPAPNEFCSDGVTTLPPGETLPTAPPTVAPPATIPPTTTMPPQGVWDCASDETWDMELQDCVPVTTTTWPEPPPTTQPPVGLPPISMEECLENGGEVDGDTCYFS